MLSRRVRIGIAFVVVASTVGISAPSASADPAVCGTSGTHTICITVPTTPLTGEATIGISDSPNGGTMLVVWQTGNTSDDLITRFQSSGTTGDYSFVWPTQKYLDATGTIKARIGKGAWVAASATLSNGNTTDFDHNVNDWQSFLPGPWPAAADPVVAASGDGPDDSAAAASVSNSIVAEDPALFLFLGDVYEEGTFVEYRTKYGASALEGGSGTSWGRLAAITQPTIGNHEHNRLVEFTDYWHGRPQYLSFMFGGVLFLDLNSSASLLPGSPQYSFVQAALDAAPPCVVSFFHIPVLSGGIIATNKQDLWALLASHGGDLVLNGHNHFLMEYEPLAADLTTPGHMVELISGAGGAGVNRAKTDPAGRIAWSLGSTPGSLSLTLDGAGSGGAASAIDWGFTLPDGSVLRTGRVVC
jgi:hypothetical protein